MSKFNRSYGSSGYGSCSSSMRSYYAATGYEYSNTNYVSARESSFRRSCSTPNVFLNSQKSYNTGRTTATQNKATQNPATQNPATTQHRQQDSTTSTCGTTTRYNARIVRSRKSSLEEEPYRKKQTPAQIAEINNHRLNSTRNCEAEEERKANKAWLKKLECDTKNGINKTRTQEKAAEEEYKKRWRKHKGNLMEMEWEVLREKDKEKGIKRYETMCDERNAKLKYEIDWKRNNGVVKHQTENKQERTEEDSRSMEARKREKPLAKWQLNIRLDPQLRSEFLHKDEPAPENRKKKTLFAKFKKWISPPKPVMDSYAPPKLIIDSFPQPKLIADSVDEHNIILLRRFGDMAILRLATIEEETELDQNFGASALPWKHKESAEAPVLHTLDEKKRLLKQLTPRKVKRKDLTRRNAKERPLGIASTENSKYYIVEDAFRGKRLQKVKINYDENVLHPGELATAEKRNVSDDNLNALSEDFPGRGEIPENVMAPVRQMSGGPPASTSNTAPAASAPTHTSGPPSTSTSAASGSSQQAPATLKPIEQQLKDKEDEIAKIRKMHPSPTKEKKLDELRKEYEQLLAERTRQSKEAKERKKSSETLQDLTRRLRENEQAIQRNSDSLYPQLYEHKLRTLMLEQEELKSRIQQMTGGGDASTTTSAPAALVQEKTSRKRPSATPSKSIGKRPLRQMSGSPQASTATVAAEEQEEMDKVLETTARQIPTLTLNAQEVARKLEREIEQLSNMTPTAKRNARIKQLRLQLGRIQGRERRLPEMELLGSHQPALATRVQAETSRERPSATTSTARQNTAEALDVVRQALQETDEEIQRLFSMPQSDEGLARITMLERRLSDLRDEETKLQNVSHGPSSSQKTNDPTTLPPIEKRIQDKRHERKEMANMLPFEEQENMLKKLNEEINQLLAEMHKQDEEAKERKKSSEVTPQILTRRLQFVTEKIKKISDDPMAQRRLEILREQQSAIQKRMQQISGGPQVPRIQTTTSRKRSSTTPSTLTSKRPRRELSGSTEASTSTTPTTSAQAKRSRMRSAIVRIRHRQMRARVQGSKISRKREIFKFSIASGMKREHKKVKKARELEKVIKRTRIITLSEFGCTNAEMCRHLGLSKATVHDILNKYNETGMIKDKDRTGRPRKITDRDEREIVRTSVQSPRMTAPQIAREFNAGSDVQISVETVKVILKRNGLPARRPAKKPYISEKNRKERLRFAKKYRHWKVNRWRRVLWSDESKFEITSDGIQWVRRRAGTRLDPENMVGTVKHGSGSIMVWGSFVGGRIGPLHRITGTMDATGYTRILRYQMLRWSKKKTNGKPNCPPQWKFQQDNDPKHKSRMAQNFLARNRIRCLRWPSQSPDLNPIENLWSYLETEVNKRKAKDEEEKFQFLMEAWKNIPEKMLKDLADSMILRLAELLKRKGRSIKY